MNLNLKTFEPKKILKIKREHAINLLQKITFSFLHKHTVKTYDH